MTDHVTVIGLGPMGQAITAVLLRSGHRVSVWNRTPSRADRLVADGAVRAGSVADAVVAGDLVVLSLTDYPAMYDILGPHVDLLAGKVLVNLSSDTPDAAREATAWAAGHGAEFVTGGLMVPAPAVGGPGAYAFYSGPAEVFARCEPTLRLLGDPRYLGPDPGLAQLFYQANLEVFLTSLAGLLHATALVTAAGVPAADFLPGALDLLTAVPAMIGDGVDLAARLEAGDHPGDLSTATMMGATAGHIVATSERSGVDPRLPRVVEAQYAAAIAAGRGRENWTVLYELLAPWHGRPADPPPGR
jgi:3-hydroxyisobutyrate dehydrogenase-like beta-hydroxyacid dehydrogenase